jgi:hypothetical protein
MSPRRKAVPFLLLNANTNTNTNNTNTNTNITAVCPEKNLILRFSTDKSCLRVVFAFAFFAFNSQRCYPGPGTRIQGLALGAMTWCRDPLPRTGSAAEQQNNADDKLRFDDVLRTDVELWIDEETGINDETEIVVESRKCVLSHCRFLVLSNSRSLEFQSSRILVLSSESRFHCQISPMAMVTASCRRILCHGRPMNWGLTGN